MTRIVAIGIVALASLWQLQAAPVVAQVPEVLPQLDDIGQSAVDQAATETREQASSDPSMVNTIVVRGAQERQSSWRRAETAQVIIYSNGSERELLEVTANIERLHFVLGQLFERGGQTPETTPRPLEIILVGGRSFIRTMAAGDGRTQAGPFTVPFANRRYYDPRPNGALLAVSRQRYELAMHEIDPEMFEDDEGLTDEVPDFADIDADGLDDGFNADVTFAPSSFASPRSIAQGGGGRRAAEPRPIRRDWQTQVYDAYARHYLQSYLPGAYPSWYLDGIGAIFANLGVRDSGSLEFGRQPPAMRTVLRSYEPLSTEPILTGEYLADPDTRHLWTPDHAWALTHFLLFGNPPEDMRRAFYSYMAAIGQGVPQAEAASVFGDFAALDAAVMRYATSDTHYFWRPVSSAAEIDPISYRLTRGEAAILEGRVAMDTRLSAVSSPGERAAFLDSLREAVYEEAFAESSNAVLAEAQCKAGAISDCAATAAEILASAPDSPAGLAWLAIAQLRQALALPSTQRAEALSEARRAIIAANRADPEAPEPLRAYFDSFVEAGETAPTTALLGMYKVVDLVPAAPEPRLALAGELIRQGLPSEAREVLLPLTAGGYTAEEAREARIMIAQADISGPSREF